MKEQYLQGQLDLIQKIKENIIELERSEPNGVDLAFDILYLLKSIKPVK